MGFDDLEEEMDEQNKQTDSQTADQASQDGPSKTTDTMNQTTSESPTTESSSSDQPAFPFDATKQDALYARPDAWQGFEDLLDLDLERELRDRGIRNVSKSEKHDAALRVLTQFPGRIADEIEKAREKN